MENVVRIYWNYIRFLFRNFKLLKLFYQTYPAGYFEEMMASELAEEVRIPKNVARAIAYAIEDDDYFIQNRVKLAEFVKRFLVELELQPKQQ